MACLTRRECGGNNPLKGSLPLAKSLEWAGLWHMLADDAQPGDAADAIANGRVRAVHLDSYRVLTWIAGADRQAGAVGIGPTAEGWSGGCPSQ